MKENKEILIKIVTDGNAVIGNIENQPFEEATKIACVEVADEGKIEVIKTETGGSVLNAKESNFIWDWSKKHPSQFVGFVDYYLPSNLKADVWYGFTIGPVALLADRVQLVVLLFEATEDGCDWYENRPAGLLVEDYRIGSEEYFEMIRNVYAGGWETLVAAYTDEIADAFGTIRLKEKDGKLCLDWKSFYPEQTPVSEAWKFGMYLAERIKKASA